MNFYLSEPQLDSLQVLSQRTGLKVAELIRRALFQIRVTPYLHPNCIKTW